MGIFSKLKHKIVKPKREPVVIGAFDSDLVEIREDGKEWIFCSGCSNGLYRDWDGYTDPYSADAPVKYPTRWIEVHYDCDKEYIEVDGTVMDWLGG